MTAVVFVFEAAVNNDLVVIQVVIGAIEDLDQGFTRDARQALGFVGGEMGELEGRCLVHVHYGRKTGGRGTSGLDGVGWNAVLVLLGIHDVSGMLKHAERPAELARSPGGRADRLPYGGERRARGTSGRSGGKTTERLGFGGKERAMGGRATVLGRGGDGEAFVQTQRRRVRVGTVAELEGRVVFIRLEGYGVGRGVLHAGKTRAEQVGPSAAGPLVTRGHDVVVGGGGDVGGGRGERQGVGEEAEGRLVGQRRNVHGVGHGGRRGRGNGRGCDAFPSDLRGGEDCVLGSGHVSTARGTSRPRGRAGQERAATNLGRRIAATAGR